MRKLLLIIFAALFTINASAQRMVTIATNAWANNSVNTVIFRKNALVTYKGEQYAAYYDTDQNVVLAKRKTGKKTWQVMKTPYKGDATDAHKSISIMIDGLGFLHVAWGQHNNSLNYARGTSPGSLNLGEKQQMTGDTEASVSYPEFYRMAGGNLLFFYRDGGSGRGNLLVNRYDLKTQKWQRLQNNLIDGEGQRNAYWQITADVGRTIHISWVWRESPNVASNHDMAYACSKDGGKTWQKSTGEKYQLPITAATAEYACRIPQNSDLMNQTSMYADAQGNPYIVNYWKDAEGDVSQYHIVFKSKGKWTVNSLNTHKTPFTLAGTGTKSLPMSRPQFVAWPKGKALQGALIFRDEERGNKVSVALTKNLLSNKWEVKDLSSKSVGAWEPTFDTELWNQKKVLNLFVENVIQVDGEGLKTMPPQPVEVLEWTPF